MPAPSWPSSTSGNALRRPNTRISIISTDPTIAAMAAIWTISSRGNAHTDSRSATASGSCWRASMGATIGGDAGVASVAGGLSTAYPRPAANGTSGERLGVISQLAGEVQGISRHIVSMDAEGWSLPNR
ncbi:MAG: hypothetical protein U5O69_06170 [Candidatus Competibacteraceae bacterium]|nr:hypothetical protein [Candidatus Competibacteraceae bacterium]